MRLAEPEVLKNINLLRDISKRKSDLDEIVEKYQEYKSVQKQIAEAEEIMNNYKNVMNRYTYLDL